jgi:hypothetical protein
MAQLRVIFTGLLQKGRAGLGRLSQGGLNQVPDVVVSLRLMQLFLRREGLYLSSPPRGLVWTEWQPSLHQISGDADQQSSNHAWL